MRFATPSILGALALVFVANMAMAQEVITGFRGKRFFVEPTISFFPSLGGPSLFKTNLYSTHETSRVMFSIPFRGGVGLHYITGRRTNIMLRYEFFPVGLNAILNTPLPPFVINQYDENDLHELFFELDTHIFSFGYEYSPKSMLSPIGPYTRLSLEYMMYNTIIKDKVTTYKVDKERNQTQHLAIGVDNVTGTDFGFGLDLGYRGVIAKKILFNWAICGKVNIGSFAPEPFPVNGSRKKYSSLDDTYLEENRTLVRNAATRRIGNHWLMVNIGFAYPF
jgi:hypothetical protein